MVKKSKIRVKTRRRKMRGGQVKLEFDTPEVNATSSSQAIEGVMHKQNNQNNEMAELNKTLAGGAVVVPQLAAAGGEGNKSITNNIATTLQGQADSEYDNDVYKGGRRRRRRRRKSRKNKSRRSRGRKSKKRNRRRKSKRRTRRRR